MITPDSSKFKIIKVLSEDSLEKLRHQLLNTKVINGLNSLRDPRGKEVLYSFKRNKEAGLPAKEFINLTNKKDISDFTCYSSFKGNPIYSLMSDGDYYRPHFDNVSLGHFSHTLFINPPDTYEGGELELLVDGELKEFKLDPGYAVVYETGTPHQVKPVTKGERKVVVWWTASYIPVMEDLYKWRAYNKLTDNDYPKDKDDIILSLKEFASAEGLYHKNAAASILRNYLK